MVYELSLQNFTAKNIYSLGDAFRGKSKNGEELSFTNYYMEKNGMPFFGVSGEFHYSRMSDAGWEDELIKMKMCGINAVATYVFWIHHEEQEGVFNFSGRRDLRKFIGLCHKHGLYVILRVGPFDHGEVRNGGMPDWLYGKPFEVRKLNEGFLHCTERLYTRIAKEVEGFFFKDGGPIVGVQIDNEYMHSSSIWENTVGTSEEWVFGGDEGEAYMLRMKELAAECGLNPVFYTCTGWGGAITPDTFMPLWGGYAFRPWLFYSYKGEHPATDEYIYQDFHNNNAECNYDFNPRYKPEERPYACCEMGGGMSCSYYYRFQYPYKSVDAMANIKLASGCNFLGYYMFQGGSNPLGEHGTFMNEGQVPKISYDYQAALGEFGQVRESYRRLKNIHYFVTTFPDKLCSLKTVLPVGASHIDPKDMETLRYAVRTDGKRGFLFVNNYQDHMDMPNREREQITLHLDKEDVTFDFGIAGDENAILPFHFDMDGIDLVMATAQAVTRIAPDGGTTYVFFTPKGMRASFLFEKGTAVNGKAVEYYECSEEGAELFHVQKDDTKIDVLVVDRTFADKMYLVCGGRLMFSEGALLEDENGIRLETTKAVNELLTFPASASSGETDGIFEHYRYETEEVCIEPVVEQVADRRYTIELPGKFMRGLKDARLQIDYNGDIGHLFLNGRMINDNFANHATWEIGLKDFEEELEGTMLTLYITPLKEGVNVNVESSMAARMEEVDAYVGILENVAVQPVYEIIIE